MAELGPLKLQNIHLSQNWKIGVPGRILQLRGAGGSAGIPADDIYYGMHVTFPAPQAGPIHAILDLTGPNPGSMLSAPHWDSNALDITSEVEVVVLEGLAPRAVMSPLGLKLGALYKHKKDAAYFTWAALDPHFAGERRGLVCVATLELEVELGTTFLNVNISEFLQIADRIGLSSRTEERSSSPISPTPAHSR